MLTRISKKKFFFRNILAKIGLARALYKYDFSASCPGGIVSDFSEDGLIGRMDARDQIVQALKDASISHIYYSVDKVLTNISTIDRHLKVYPDSDYAKDLKAAKGLQKFMWRFGGMLFGYDYYLYFERESDITAFQIVR